MAFNGFISYSHAADGRLAPAVQRGLHRLAKPWHRRRALWIFRDQTGLAVTPGLWSSIQTALDGSEYFVLLSSPEAAQSHWVNREIEHWIATKSADRILPVVTDGEWAWDRERHDFTEDSTAVPEALRGVFAEEPLFLDLRWARGSEHLSLQHSRFRDAIAQLAAPMHGVSKDELEGEDVRQHRRARRLRSGAVATLVVLTVLAGLSSVSAVRNADRATAAAAEALRQQQAAEVQRSSAVRSAEEASRQQEVARQQQVRAAAAAVEAQRSEQVAQEQQSLADRARAEARRQQQIADQAATRTREEQRLAKEAAARAQQLEQEAQRLEAEARRLAKIAEEKQREAREAAEEAKKQQAKAEHQQRIAISRRLTTQARATIVSDPKTALMLGAAAQAVLPDLETRSEVTGIVTATGYAGTISDVTAAVYGPKGVLAALGADGRVSLWNATDPANPARIATLGDWVSGSTSLTLSADGRTLAVVDPNGAAVLWDVTDRSHPDRLATLPRDGYVQLVAFSRDGTTLAVGKGIGEMTLFDLADRSRPRQLGTYEMPYSTRVALLKDLVFSPDGRTLVVNEGIDVVALDVTDRAGPFGVREISSSHVSTIAIDPSGNLALGLPDGEVYVEALSGPATARLMQDPPELPEPPEFPDDDMDPADDPDNEPFKRLHGPTSLNKIAYSPDGHYLAVSGDRGTVMAWDMTGGTKPTPVINARANGAINTVSFDQHGGRLVTGDSTATATFWNTRPFGSSDSIAALTIPKGPIRTMALRPDGRTLVAAGSDGTASSWKVTDPARPVRDTDLTIRGNKVVRSVAFSPDGRAAAAVGRDSQVTLTDLTRPLQPVVLPALASQSVTNSMAFSPDGRTLAVVVAPSRLLLWNVADLTRPALLATLSDDVWFGAALAFSPDGRYLVTGGGERPLTLWDVTDRSAPARVGRLTGHGDAALSVAFSADGRTVASGGQDGTAMLWDVTDRARPRRLARLTDHNNPVTTVTFSPDGHTLATGDSTDEVFLWDITNPVVPIRLVSMHGPGNTVQGVLFKRDGRTLVVAANTTGVKQTGTVTLWNYAKLHSILPNPAKYACAMTGRGLDAGEWATYIPELPYRRSCRG
ncbi:TIR domain-containing protein [Actinoplanes sp. NPDC026623]|uniref:TIR domain-containing protein n=1 Tax=Actinoplanes sp. NPDC026623 TaxID=3155610 RepID=UPI0033C8AF1E